MSILTLLRPRACARAIDQRRTATAERLEERQLMSRVALDTFSISSSGATATSAFTLRNGVDYQVQVSGTVVINRQYDRQADAEYGQRLPNYNWTDLSKEGFDWGVALGDESTPTKVVWGPFSLDHVYTTTHTGQGKKLTAKLNDDFYPDNSGSLSLTIYGPEQFNADLKATDGSNAGNSATADSASTVSLALSENASHQASLSLGASDALPTSYAGAGGTWNSTAKAFFVWSITPVSDGATSNSGGDLNASTTATLTDSGNTNGGEFLVRSGFDSNGNGQLDSGEIQRTIDVQLA